jgi:hypothetical protein
VRKVKAYIQIQAPVHRVRSLAGTDMARWMVTRANLFRRTRTATWEATEVEGGTRFTLQMEYGAPLSFLDSLVADGLHHCVTRSLSNLKSLAEASDSAG